MNAIVCVAKNWAIGKDNHLLFHLPGDLRRFRELTSGGTIIMGRKTLESFPNGKPLLNRRNIVISKNCSFVKDGVEVVHSIDEALAVVDVDSEDVWVIGGGSIFTEMLSQCKAVYVTMVDAVADADAFFPNLDKLPFWSAVQSEEPVTENGLSYQFIKYAK